MNFEPFIFMPGMTIEAVLRMKNKYVSGDKLKLLLDAYHQKNGRIIPKPGNTFLIPILPENDQI